MLPELTNHLSETFEFDLQKPVGSKLEDAMKSLEDKLAKRIDYMMRYESENLTNALYRMDVDERKLNAAMNTDDGIELSARIARLVIDRHIQKIETRKKYGSTNSPDWSFDLE